MPILNWIGKEAVVNHDKEVPFRLLKKVKSLSYGENSQNLIIHGDNLEALKALMPYYQGKVKCIYIDPPYNTGNEGWIYNDKVNSPKIKKWLGKVVGSEAEDLCHHDKWLCMMYPRLKLLRELLANDGAIFISIDDNELSQLKQVMDEIFLESNFMCILPRLTKKGGKSSDNVSKNNDYVLVYSKTNTVNFKKLEHNDEGFKYKDEYFEERGLYKLNQTLDYDSIQYSPSLDYEIEIEGEVIRPGGASKQQMEKRRKENPTRGFCWRWSKKLFDFGLKNGFIVVKKYENKPSRIYTKTYQNATISQDAKGNYVVEITPRSKPISTIDFVDNDYSNDRAKKELRVLFGNVTFDYPKPIELVKKILEFSSDKESFVLDSFAGSGTTAQAVLQLNKEDGGERKFILVEMEDYANEVTAERVRRAIKKYDYKAGFEFCELDKPLFDENGQIEQECTFEQLATYIYFTETNTNIDKKEISGNFIGNYGETEYYLIFKEKGKNILNKEFLKKLQKDNKKKIIYADKCLIDDKTLERYKIQFKQIPYEVKVY
jgi:adenine-specific DNA-methyltransferase